MRFVWITLDGAGLPLAQRLIEEGHEVIVYIANQSCAQLYDGILPKAENLNFLAKDSERKSYIILDHVGFLKPALTLRQRVRTMGELGDHLRDLGFKVFGCNRFTERLELDRNFAKEVCEIVGIKIPRTLTFSSLQEALQLLQQNRGRWVFKPDNNVAPTYVAQEPDSSDLIMHIQTLIEDKALPGQVSGVLEEYVDGVECSLEGWYQYGDIIPGSLNITLETKVAFPHQTGPTVGCSTSAVCPVRPSSLLFMKTLARLAGVFKRFKVTAPVDINTITPPPKGKEEPEPVFLEFCGGRFGYSAIFEFMELLENELGQLLADILDKKPVTISLKAAWGYGIRVWHPPAPWHPDDKELAKAVFKKIEGTYIFLSPRAPKEIHRHIWWQDVKLEDKNGKQLLVLVGTDGTICEITGVGSTIPKAAAQAEYFYKFLHTEHNDHWARLDGGQPQQYRWGVLQSWRLVAPPFKPQKVSSVSSSSADAVLTAS